MTAVQCSQCSKLIPHNGDYLHVLEFHIKHHVGDGATKYRQQRAWEEGLKNAVFCNLDCFSNHIAHRKESNDQR